MVFPQEGGFGPAVVGAQSTGTPVIAFQKRGILDIINKGKTKIFFKKREKKIIIDAAIRFDRIKFGSKIIEENAKRFSKERFNKEFEKIISHL